MIHDVTQPDDEEIKVDIPTDNVLLAYMAGKGYGTSPGDIWQDLGINHAPSKNKIHKGNDSNHSPRTCQFGEMTYYLNKGETIYFQGQNCLAHMACIPNCVRQYDVGVMEKALGDDMTVIERSESIVDVFWLAGHKVSQLQIVTAQSLMSTHKSDVIATFHQMAWVYFLAFTWKPTVQPCFNPVVNKNLYTWLRITIVFWEWACITLLLKTYFDETCFLLHVIRIYAVDCDPKLDDNDIESLVSTLLEYWHSTVATNHLLEE
jgi:hypothetical protein